jgi:hypothetical protein
LAESAERFGNAESMGCPLHVTALHPVAESINQIFLPDFLRQLGEEGAFLFTTWAQFKSHVDTRIAMMPT